METIVSLGILALVAIAVLNLFPTAMLTVKGAEARNRARVLAENLLDHHRSLPVTDLPIGFLQEETVSVEGFTYQTTIQVISVGHDALMRGLVVEVAWSRRGLNHSVRRELEVVHVRR